MMIRLTETKWLLAALAITVALGIALPCASQAEGAEKSSYDQAMEFYYAGKYEEAAKLLKEYVKDNADPKAYFRLGYSLYKLGRHEEANKYFDQSYLVTPAYTPTPELEEKHKRLDDVRPEGFYEGKIPLPDLQVEPPPKIPEGMVAVEMPSTLDVPSQEEEAELGTEEEMESAETVTGPEIEEAIDAQVEEEPVVEEPKPEKPAPEPVKPIEPAQTVQPEQLPFELTDNQAMLAALAIMSAFLIPIIAIFVFIYLLISLTIFKIAKKLNVDKAFLAWIPLAQVFPFTWAAGKSTLWGVIFLLASLFLGPIGMIIGLYFWMCIAENLGKNKFLGLLMLVPLINIAFMLYLAFSKSDVGGLAVISSDVADVPDMSGEPDLDLPDIPDDLDDMGDIGGGGDMGEMPDLDDMDFDEPDLNESEL